MIVPLIGLTIENESHQEKIRDIFENILFAELGKLTLKPNH